MAVNYGSSNTNRFHTVADSDDFNLPNGDWTWLVIFNPSVGGSVFPYWLSHGGTFGGANTMQLFHNGANGFACSVAGLSVRNWGGGNMTPHVGKWMIGYGARRSGSLYAGACPINEPWSASESAGVAISSAYTPATALKIGIRSDLTSDATYSTKSRMSDVIFVPGYGMSINDLRRLASCGLKDLTSEPWYKLRKFHAYLRTSQDAEFSDLSGKHKIVRNGTGYSADESELFNISREKDRNFFALSWPLFSAANDTTLAASGSGSISASASLLTSIRLAASGSFSVSTSSALTTSINLAASGAVGLNASSALNTSIRFAASVPISLTTIAALTAGSSGLAASVFVGLSASGNLTTQIRFNVSASCGFSSNADLNTAITFAASASASLSTFGALNTSINFASAASVSLVSIAALQAGASADLAASCAMGLTASAGILTGISLAGGSSISVSAIADLQSSLQTLIGASVNFNLTASAALTTSIRMAGSASLSVTASASVSGVEIQAPFGAGFVAGKSIAYRNVAGSMKIRPSSRNPTRSTLH